MRKAVIWMGALAMLSGAVLIWYGTILAMTDPGWSTPAPNTQHISPTPWPSR